MKHFFVYILKCRDGKYYTGYTNDLSKRLKLHWSGHGSLMAKTKKPFKLVYIERYDNQYQALKREKQIKGWRREKKENLIKYGKPIV
jgi:predicted GIY-YIG superfamily endonuclease